ncbi:hypothetical protein [Botrimarina sp.]|uniref:hypothetical protein n=1 Tax=Botrimarina sp. TaxID=2795802 RepID=UPI0032EB3A54
MRLELPYSTLRVRSVGSAAQLLQLMPARIGEIADALGIEPTWVLNGVAHYSEADLELIRRRHLETLAEAR